MDYLAIANAPIFWALCGITVVISLAQALLFMRQAKRAAVEVNLEQGLANKAFKIGLISAIGRPVAYLLLWLALWHLLADQWHGFVFPLSARQLQSFLQQPWVLRQQVLNLEETDTH